MTVSEKIKTITKQSKTKLNLIWTEKQFSALSSGNIGKYEFLAGKDVLPEKALLEKAAIIKYLNFYHEAVS